MENPDKTKEQLIGELEELRQRVAESEVLNVSRKKAEKALQESEEKYRRLFGTVSDAIVVFDADTRRFIDVNESALHLYGYTREEMLQLEQTDITAELSKSEDSIEATLRGELDRVPLRYHRKKDGTVFPVEISAGVFALGDRKVVCGVIRDITECKQTDEALRESERRLRSVLETMELVAVMLDVKGNITFCNDFLLNLTGWKREEVLGNSWFEMFLPVDIQGEIERSVFLKAIQTGEFSAHYENDIITRQGERRLVAWNNTVFRDPQGNIISVTSIGEDVTERKRAEEALRESERRD